MDKLRLRLLGSTLVIGGREWFAMSDHRRLAEQVAYAARSNLVVREAVVAWYVRNQPGISRIGGNDLEIVDQLVRAISSGFLAVVEIREWTTINSPDTRPPHPARRLTEPPPPPTANPAPLPPIEKAEVVDSPRSLLITNCPPQFDPREERLRVSYLLRELEGFPVEFLIRSVESPDPPLHRRMLSPAETRTGPGTIEWDGTLDATGEIVQRPLAPFTIELVYDSTYRDEAPTTLPPKPSAHFLEMEDLVFCTDREVLLPQSLGALIMLMEFAREHAEKRILVAGHTDTAGSESHNAELSERRAQNVHLWLSGDADGWAAHCQSNFEIADFKAVHAWAHDHLGWPTDPGDLDNEWHQQARHARDVFRSECEALLNVELEHHVAQNEADWRAIHDLYSLIAGRYLNLELDEFLELRRSLHFTSAPTVACGEAYPRERTGDDVANATNRRVEVLFFDPDEEPDISVEPPGEAVYGEEQYEFTELHPRDLDPLTPTIFEIDICLADHWHQSLLASTPYSVSGPLPERLFNREGMTDDAGVLHEELLPSGYYELRVGKTHLIVMAHPVGFSDPTHPQVGPNFRDVYRVARQHESPVFPPVPSENSAGEWTVPAYVPGPDKEVGIVEEFE